MAFNFREVEHNLCIAPHIQPYGVLRIHHALLLFRLPLPSSRLRHYRPVLCGVANAVFPFLPRPALHGMDVLRLPAHRHSKSCVAAGALLPARRVDAHGVLSQVYVVAHVLRFDIRHHSTLLVCDALFHLCY